MAYAQIQNGLVVCLTQSADAPAAGTLGVAGVSWTLVPGTPAGIDCGWTFDGTAWAPPAPSAEVVASTTVQTLAATLGGYIAQATADAATLEAMTPADLTSQPALDIQIRMVAGMAQLLTGIQALVVAIGAAPPP